LEEGADKKKKIQVVGPLKKRGGGVKTPEHLSKKTHFHQLKKMIKT